MVTIEVKKGTGKSGDNLGEKKWQEKVVTIEAKKGQEKVCQVERQWNVGIKKQSLCGYIVHIVPAGTNHGLCCLKLKHLCIWGARGVGEEFSQTEFELEEKGSNCWWGRQVRLKVWTGNSLLLNAPSITLLDIYANISVTFRCRVQGCFPNTICAV